MGSYLQTSRNGPVHMLRGLQEGFELGSGSEAGHIGGEQRVVIQVTRIQELMVQEQV